MKTKMLSERKKRGERSRMLSSSRRHTQTCKANVLLDVPVGKNPALTDPAVVVPIEGFRFGSDLKFTNFLHVSFTTVQDTNPN